VSCFIDIVFTLFVLLWFLFFDFHRSFVCCLSRLADLRAMGECAGPLPGLLQVPHRRDWRELPDDRHGLEEDKAR
jgi:hypothetical protein